jgi:phosphinothricin acetyltransferase
MHFHFEPMLPEYRESVIDMLNHLVDKAKQKGIWSILASISSLNEGSINFHKKNGFIECGRFKNVGRKKGQIFDTVWMQKML